MTKKFNNFSLYAMVFAFANLTNFILQYYNRQYIVASYIDILFILVVGFAVYFKNKKIIFASSAILAINRLCFLCYAIYAHNFYLNAFIYNVAYIIVFFSICAILSSKINENKKQIIEKIFLVSVVAICLLEIKYLIDLGSISFLLGHRKSELLGKISEILLFISIFLVIKNREYDTNNTNKNLEISLDNNFFKKRNSIDGLKNYKELLDSGIITTQELEEYKSAIFSEDKTQCSKIEFKKTNNRILDFALMIGYSSLLASFRLARDIFLSTGFGIYYDYFYIVDHFGYNYYNDYYSFKDLYRNDFIKYYFSEFFHVPYGILLIIGILLLALFVFYSLNKSNLVIDKNGLSGKNVLNKNTSIDFGDIESCKCVPYKGIVVLSKNKKDYFFSFENNDKICEIINNVKYFDDNCRKVIAEEKNKIEKIKETFNLFEEGIISKTEFETKKQSILNS